MRIAVAGATGNIGALTAAALARAGHDVVRISRSVGVDLFTGDGLDAALTLLGERAADVAAADDSDLHPASPFSPTTPFMWPRESPTVPRRTEGTGSSSPLSSHSRQIQSRSRCVPALSSAGTIVTPQAAQIGGRSSYTSAVCAARCDLMRSHYARFWAASAGNVPCSARMHAMRPRWPTSRSASLRPLAAPTSAFRSRSLGDDVSRLDDPETRVLEERRPVGHQLCGRVVEHSPRLPVVCL